MKKDITELFCIIDDFCQALDHSLSSHPLGSSRLPTRRPEVTLSEMVRILKSPSVLKLINLKSNLVS